MPDRKPPAQYDVGYGRPPRATQFQPGKSGNPKGRPKGSQSMAVILRKVIGQKVKVTENGKARRISMIEAMFRRLANDALRSDPRALKLLLSLIDHYGESPATAIDFADLATEDKASNCMAVGTRQERRDPAPHHQHATSIAEVNHGIGCLPGVSAGS